MFFDRELLQDKNKVLLPQNPCYHVTFRLEGLENKDKCGNTNCVTAALENPIYVTAETQCEQDLQAAVTRVTRVTCEKDNSLFLSKEWFLDFFNERAGMLEFDAGQEQWEANMNAFDECACKWLEINKLDFQTENIGKAIDYLVSCGLHNPFYTTAQII